jgi:hypothetical protein
MDTIGAATPPMLKKDALADHRDRLSDLNIKWCHKEGNGGGFPSVAGSNEAVEQSVLPKRPLAERTNAQNATVFPYPVICRPAKI